MSGRSSIARQALAGIAKDAGRSRLKGSGMDKRPHGQFEVTVGQAELEPPRRRGRFDVQVGQAELEPSYDVEVGQAVIEEEGPRARRYDTRDLADSNAIGRDSGALPPDDVDDLEDEELQD